MNHDTSGMAGIGFMILMFPASALADVLTIRYLVAKPPAGRWAYGFAVGLLAICAVAIGPREMVEFLSGTIGPGMYWMVFIPASIVFVFVAPFMKAWRHVRDTRCSNGSRVEHRSETR